MTILFLGDIVGKPGRAAVATLLPGLRKKYEADLVVANGENLAHGKGITRDTLNELLAAGVDVVTSGNHWAAAKEVFDFADDPKVPFVRPANYPQGTPGRGYHIVQVRTQKVLVINLMGRVHFKQHLSDPFRGLDSLLKVLKAQRPDVILVDFHAEATAESVAFGHHADDKVTAVVGSHTHVPTDDASVLPKGTGYVTDTGMCGPRHSVIGLTVETAIQAQLSQMPYKYEVAESEEACVNFCVIHTAQGAAGELATTGSIKRMTEIVKLA